MSSLKTTTWPFAALGMILSLYALYVEHKISHKSEDEEFSALCDIESIGASCRYDEKSLYCLYLEPSAEGAI